jgi:predicted MFS family arabinose efflux permease
MFCSLAYAPSFPVLVLLHVVNGIAMGLYWAPLEAVVSRLSPPNRVRANMGWYNLSWSLGMAVGYFVYWVFPVLETWAFHFGGLLFLVTCLLLGFLRAPDAGARPLHALDDATRMPFDGRRRYFLLASWAGVFVAYIGVGAARSLFQKLGDELELTKQTVSLICGFGLIAQTITMSAMGRFEGWHYKKWVLFVGEIGLVAAGLSIAMGTRVPVLSAGHILLGIGMSMVYSSSLFYSMEDQAHAHRNTSVHEGLIGMGHTVLPFIGFAADAFRFTPLTYYVVAGLAILLLIVQISAFYTVKSSWERDSKPS